MLSSLCLWPLRIIDNFQPHIDKLLANSSMYLKVSHVFYHSSMEKYNFLTSNIKPQGIVQGIIDC